MERHKGPYHRRGLQEKEGFASLTSKWNLFFVLSLLSWFFCCLRPAILIVCWAVCVGVGLPGIFLSVSFFLLFGFCFAVLFLCFCVFARARKVTMYGCLSFGLVFRKLSLSFSLSPLSSRCSLLFSQSSSIIPIDRPLRKFLQTCLFEVQNLWYKPKLERGAWALRRRVSPFLIL